MLLNKEQCDVIMKEAFDGVTMPSTLWMMLTEFYLNASQWCKRLLG